MNAAFVVCRVAAHWFGFAGDLFNVFLAFSLRGDREGRARKAACFEDGLGGDSKAVLWTRKEINKEKKRKSGGEKEESFAMATALSYLG